MTKNGIEYDLNKSPYHVYVHDYCFAFSSKLYQQKFCNRLSSYIEKVSVRLSKNLNLDCDYTLICAFSLYSTIEKRGFLVTHGGAEISCQKQIQIQIEIQNQQIL